MRLDGRYELTRLLQEGGMAFVYRGRHLRLGSEIAIKLMKTPERSCGVALRRFELEARAASQLKSPHVMAVIDVGKTCGGVWYIASELILGTTLAEVLRNEVPLAVLRGLRIFFQILAAVEDAHTHRVIHRDLKPDNVMVTMLRSGVEFVKLVDFGIARVEDATGPRVTLPGEAFGTPEYMAPEQIRGEEPDPRVDLYACGVILFELLTGRLPFQGRNNLETMNLHLTQAPPSSDILSTRKLPAGMDAVMARALAKRREDRFQTAAQFRDALHLLVVQDTERTLFDSNGLPWEGPALACAPGQSRNPCANALTNGESPDTGSLITPVSLIVNITPFEAHQGQPPRLPRTSTVSRLPKKAAAAQEHRAAASHAMTRRPPPTPMTLHGREHELDLLGAFLAGEMPVLEMLAPDGTGRTALLDELAGMARRRGLQVLRADPDPSGGHTPWHAARELLRQALGVALPTPGATTLTMAALERGLSVQDVPGLVEVFRDRTTPNAFSDGVVAFREALSATLRVLTHPAAGRPRRCYVIDDAGELDGPSGEMVRWLARLAEESCVKLVMAARSSILSPEGLHSTIYLRPLDDAALDQMIVSRLGSNHVAEVAAARLVAARPGCSLLHLDQVLRALVSENVDVSGSTDDLVHGRLASLDPTALAVLNGIAVLGRSAPMEVVLPLVGGPADLPGERKRLIAGGWLKDADANTCVMAHPVIANMVHELISAERRQALHRAALDIQEACGQPATVLARHAEEGWLYEKALELWEHAGDLCAAAQAYRDAALVHYQSAIRVARWKLLMAESDPDHARVSLKFGDSLRLAGQAVSSEAVLRALVHATQEDPTTRARARLSLARLERSRGRLAEAMALTADVVTEALESQHGDLALEASVENAEMLAASGQVDVALHQLEECGWTRAGATTRKHAGRSWKFLSLVAVLTRRQGEARRSVEAATQAVNCARRCREPVAQARCHLLTADALDADHRQDEADCQLGLAEELFRKVGDRRGLAEALIGQARRGRGPRTPAMATEAVMLAEQVQWWDGAQAARQLAAGT
jgi:serine/threonine-protein kinase